MLPEYAVVDTHTLLDLSRLQTSKFLNAAALGIFAFDYCLTFSTEVEYVWGTKWGPTRIVFTLARYLPFIACPMTCYDVIVNPFCGGFVTALDVLYISSVIFAEVVLLLRTYALWGRSKSMLIFLLMLAGVFIAAAEVLSRLVKISLPGDSTSAYQFYPSLCAHQSSRGATLQYAFLMGYEIILQCMNSWRRFRTYRSIHSKMLDRLYWDGILYMWWIIALSVANMTVEIAAPITFIPALHTAQVAIHSLLASRIFFNLREIDEQTARSRDMFSLEEICFQFHTTSTAGATTQAQAETVE